MANSYFVEKYSGYEQTSARLPSPREFFETLDAQFNFFLQQNRQEDMPEWREVLERRPLSIIIPELLPELDLSSEEPLTPTQYKTVMLKMQWCISDLTNDPKYEEIAQAAHATTLAVAAQEVFQSDRVTTDMALTFERFFCWLIETHFRQPENPVQERALFQQRLFYEINLFMTAAALILNENTTAQRIFNNSILTLFEYDTDPEVIQTIFIKLSEHLHYGDSFIEKVEAVFREHAAECWITTSTVEKVRVVILGDQKRGEFAKITTPNDFYFTDTDECDDTSYESDIFPRQSFMVPSKSEYRNSAVGFDCSVFRADGVKVFWGDLLTEHATSLKGRYYVLPEAASVGPNVPECAITEKSPWPATEPYAVPNAERLAERPRDITELDPGYVRLMASHKIENGQVIPHENTYTCVIGSLKELNSILRGEDPTEEYGAG